MALALAETNPFAHLSLQEFIPRISPEFRSPWHLQDWTDQIELAATGVPVRALCDCAIRHHKTETTLHGLVWLLVKNPAKRYLFLTHSFERARTIGKRIRRLAEVAGVGPIRGYDTIETWSNERGGGAIVMSAEQSRLGEDVHGVFFDDPLDEHASMDQKRRDAVDETITHYTARCMWRGQPGPVMGVMSRWHPDDPIGRRLLRTAVEWRHIHHPAIVDEGLPTERAFAPEVWPLDALRAMREELREQDPTERIWWAQLQGDPKPIGSAKFRPDVERYDVLPDWNFRLAFGADLAFTSGDGSDYFAMGVLKVIGTKGYLIDMARTKLEAHQIESTAKAFQNKYGAGPIFSYVSGPEVGMLKLMRERGLPFYPLRARYSKLVRAERTIKRWNDGNILVPRVAPWLPGFLSRVGRFTGAEKDRDDDEVDALVSVCDGAMGGIAAGSVRTMGRAYSGFQG